MLGFDPLYIADKRELIDHLLRFHLPTGLTLATIHVMAGWDQDVLDLIHREYHTPVEMAS